MSDHTILVAGATGTVGTGVIRALLERGAHPRAMTRNPEHRVAGAETAVADLRDPDTLPQAVDGVHSLFLNSPSTEDAAELQIRFADIAAEQGVSRIVLLSQYGADTSSPVRFLRWHGEVEQHVHNLDLAVTILRPNLYLQSLLSFVDSVAHGTLVAPIGDAAVSAIDTRDISDAAAAALATDGHDGRTYTLTGPRAVTHAEIAEALGTAMRRPITFHDIPSSEFAAALEGFLPPWQVGGVVEDYAHYARGEAADVTTAVADLTGRTPRDLVDFARDAAEGFRHTG